MHIVLPFQLQELQPIGFGMLLVCNTNIVEGGIGFDMLLVCNRNSYVQYCRGWKRWWLVPGMSMLLQEFRNGTQQMQDAGV